MLPAGVEIETVRPERTASFRSAHERDALSTEWGFRIVWHEQRHEFAASLGGDIVGVLALRIAASLGHVESLIVAAERRRLGIGGLLVERAESVANYYNCHKVTLEAPAASGAQTFFETRGYKVEAILRQHTWKRDVAVMRKFLL